MRSFAYVMLAAAVAAGCGETVPPAVSPDLMRDASVPHDGGPDGSIGTDGGTEPDASLDAGADGGVLDGGGSWCTTSALCPACPDPEALCDERNPCSVGQVCLSTGCEDYARCFTVGGGACENDTDCGDPAYACNAEVGRCLRSEPGCADSNDCVAGFSCEDGVCVDRRLPCTRPLDCPHGYRCFVAAPDQRFCRRITRPCADDLDCLVLGVPCGDADGDGAKECMPSLTPTGPDPVACDGTRCPNADAPVCEPIPEGTVAVCGRFGPCASAAQCAPGFQCIDLFGDGRRECVLPEGSCADSRDCGVRALCASSRDGRPPACIDAESM